VDKEAVILDRRKISAFGKFLGVLFFLDVQRRDTDHVIPTQCQFDGFMEIHLARSRRVCLLPQRERLR
jgi:hypothetical protein